MIKKITPIPDLSEETPIKVCSALLLGKSKREVREHWKQITDSKNVYLQEDNFVKWIKGKRGFLTLRCLETDEIICQADFEDGKCIGHSSLVEVDYSSDVVAELRSKGLRYDSRCRRFTKTGASYTWRVQRVENGYSVTCRRLLPPKVAKSDQNH